MKKADQAMIREMFLTLWDDAVKSPDYEKQRWRDFRKLLKEFGINV